MAVSTAAKLKDEGNTFFVKKDYEQAYQKYADALKANDVESSVVAVPYANRATCAHNMHRYASSVVSTASFRMHI